MVKKNGKSAEQFQGVNIEKITPSNCQGFIYNNTTKKFELEDIIPTLGDSISNFICTQDNDGVERKPVFEKFENNTIAAYTLTGAPTIASGVCTLATTEKLIRTIDAYATTGKWDAIPKFTTAWGVDQSGKLYFGATSYIDVIRKTGNAIWLQLTVNGVSLISATDTTATLADDTYGRAIITYDGTNYQMQWNGTNVGSATAGNAPITPSLGFLATASGVVLNEMNYLPSQAWTDPYTSDTESRYMQLSTTNITMPNTTGTWAASAAGDVVIGAGICTLASDDDEAICAPLRSYMHASGEIEFSFDCNNDGGGGADSTGYVFCYQDILNHYKIVIEDDDGAGTTELLSIYKVVAGTATKLGTSKDVTARYAKGTQVTIKLQYSRETGQMWAYLKDNTGANSGYYPTTPDIADAFSTQFAYGKSGAWAAVTTAGAGNLNVAFYPATWRTALLAGETNIPAYESGFVFSDDASANALGRYTYDSARIAYNAATPSYRCTVDANEYIGIIEPMYTAGDGTYSTSYAIIDWTNNNYVRNGLVISKSLSTNTWVSQNGYYFRTDVTRTGISLVVYRYDGGTATIISITVVPRLTFALNDVIATTIIKNGGVYNVEIFRNGVSRLTRTVTDTTYLSGYWGVMNPSGTGITDTGINDFTLLSFTGTRYYMKPMLRGAQIGATLISGVETPCTRFISSGDYDQISEFTLGGSASAFDTTNGRLILADGTAIYPTAISMKEGHYAFQLLRSGASGVANFTIANNAITVTYAGVITIGGTAYTGTALTSPVWVEFVATGTQIAVYSAGTLIGTKTGLTLAYSPISMSRTTANVYVLNMAFNALDSSSTNGVSASLGGVPHGGRYDVQEEVYSTFTNKILNGEFFLSSAAQTTYPTGQNFEYYFANTTDTTAINWDNQTLATLTAGTTWTDGIARILLRYQDLNDTIKLSARRKTYSGVSTDNQPVVFISRLKLVPLWGVV